MKKMHVIVLGFMSILLFGGCGEYSTTSAPEEATAKLVVQSVEIK